MSAENALADLGLDLNEAAPTEAVAAQAPVTEADATTDSTVSRRPVEVGEIEIDEEGGELPPLVRAGFGGGPRGSKYPFDKLGAPVQDGDTVKYKSFTVQVPEGEDAERVTRSVQSATTQANRAAKEAGEATYFVTRTFNNEAGATAGIRVYRTDARPEKGE